MTSLETITVTYDVDVDQLEILDQSLIEIYSETGMISDYTVVKQLRRAAVTIQFGTPITTPGVYQFFVGSGAFSIAGEENGEIDYAYTIVAEAETPDTPDTDPDEIDPMKVVSITPAPGVVKSISEWNLDFDCTWSLDRTSSAKYTITCSNPDVALPKLKNRSTNVYFEDDAVVTAPGTYTLTVGAGKFLLGEEGNQIPTPEYQFVYVIEEGSQAETPYEGNVEITPAPGAVSRIDSIVLTFDGEVIVDNAENVILADSNDPITNTVEADGNTLVITPESAITRYGQYVLTINAGAVTVDGHPVTAGQYVYVVAKLSAPWTGEFTANPADDSTVESIKEVSITFEGINRVTLNSIAAPADFPALYNGDTGDKLVSATSTVTTNTLKVSLYSAVTAPGTYALIIPKAYIYLDGENMSEDLILQYNIEKPADAREITYTFTPSAGSTLSFTDPISLTIEAEGLTSISHNSYAWGTQSPRFVSAEGAYVPSVQVKKVTDFAYMFSHTYAFKTAGEFTLLIPAEYFTFTFTDGREQKNEEVTVEYTVTDLSAISAIESDEAQKAADVYNTLGVCVLRDATPQQIKALPAGLYLINGQKIIIK